MHLHCCRRFDDLILQPWHHGIVRLRAQIDEELSAN